MELRHLRYFLRAAELLHFTRAAESLYISQPALSAQIKQLEDELHVQLFARVGRHVVLTEAGELFVHNARQAVQNMEKAEEDLAALQGLLRGNLRLVAIPAIGSISLPTIIDDFQKSHPNVHIKLSVRTSDNLEREIAKGDFDLGITMLPLTHDDLQSLELLTDEIVLAVSSKHPLSKQMEIHPSALNELPVALATQGLLHGDSFTFLRANNAEPKVMVELDELRALLSLVRAGRLVTFIPRMLVPDDLVAIKFVGSGPIVRLGAVWSHLGPAGQEFLQCLKAAHFRDS
jgi:LysR family cyn operon transcriptional activator